MKQFSPRSEHPNSGCVPFLCLDMDYLFKKKKTKALGSVFEKAPGHMSACSNEFGCIIVLLAFYRLESF